jgi:hypothetical protein
MVLKVGILELTLMHDWQLLPKKLNRLFRIMNDLGIMTCEVVGYEKMLTIPFKIDPNGL